MRQKIDSLRKPTPVASLMLSEAPKYSHCLCEFSEIHKAQFENH